MQAGLSQMAQDYIMLLRMMLNLKHELFSFLGIFHLTFLDPHEQNIYV